MVGAMLYASSSHLNRAVFSFEGKGPYVWIIVAGLINSFGQNIMVITMQHSNPASVSLYR